MYACLFGTAPAFAFLAAFFLSVHALTFVFCGFGSQLKERGRAQKCFDCSSAGGTSPGFLLTQLAVREKSSRATFTIIDRPAVKIPARAASQV